ncbi:MAG: formylglycine-generating enzyme family protein [Bacteroidales bacterium]
MKHLFFLCAIPALVTTFSSLSSDNLQKYDIDVPESKFTITMTAIKGGDFTMGSPSTEKGRNDDEGVAKNITIDGFWMSEAEITWGAYNHYATLLRDKKDLQAIDAITGPSTPYEDPTLGYGKDNTPAVGMTQYAALSFCKWLWLNTGQFYRLPTEAEWEYACRAGSSSPYFWGDKAKKKEIDKYCWYADNSDNKYHEVKQKLPNAWGLYDMQGNVSEWVLDQYDKDYFAKTQNKNPLIEPSALHPRSVRGASYESTSEQLRSADRTESDLVWKRRDPQIPKSFWWNTDSPFVGFRIVRPMKKYTEQEIVDFFAFHLNEL